VNNGSSTGRAELLCRIVAWLAVTVQLLFLAVYGFIIITQPVNKYGAVSSLAVTFGSPIALIGCLSAVVGIRSEQLRFALILVNCFAITAHFVMAAVAAYANA
jgi:hypothetical protein